MLAYGIVAGLAAAGYTGWPWWIVVPGASALTLHGWWTQLWRLGEPVHDIWSKKITAYFVTGIVADIAFAVVSFGLGRVARWAIG